MSESRKQFEEWKLDFDSDYDRKPTSYEIWQAAQKDALNKAADEWNDTWGASKLRKMAGEI